MPGRWIRWFFQLLVDIACSDSFLALLALNTMEICNQQGKYLLKLQCQNSWRNFYLVGIPSKAVHYKGKCSPLQQILQQSKPWSALESSQWFLLQSVACNNSDKWFTLLCLTDIKLNGTTGSVGFCNTSVHLSRSRFQMKNLNPVRQTMWKPCVPEARLSSVCSFPGDNCFMLSSSGDFSLKVNLIPGFSHPLQGSSLQGRRLKIWVWSILSSLLCWWLLNMVCWMQLCLQKSLC